MHIIMVSSLVEHANPLWQAIEKIESNANWLERDLEGVQSWLNANY